MVEPVIPLGWVEVALLIALMAAVVALSAWLRLALARDFAIGAARSVAQLTLVGFFIGWVFRQQTWYWVLGLLSLMALVAGFTGARRSGVRVPGLVLLFTVVVVLVTAVTLLYLTQLVIGVREWNPRYLIPLGGMLLGNTMTSATLAVERLVAELRGRANDVEVLLSLGANPAQAIHELRRTAIKAAVSPTLNALMTVGIVTLPGMMTGQMLGGTEPLQAAIYQLLILFGITFCALSGASLAVYTLAPRFFTAAWQIDRRALRMAL